MKLRIDNRNELIAARSLVITDAFVGPLLETDDGESLGVCMRDSGFDLTYIVNGRETHVSLNNGEVVVHPKPGVNVAVSRG